MSLRIASWNVNSIRARMASMERFVAHYQPDVLCLQETRAADAVFPLAPFDTWGYRYRALSGAVGAPGVAILSRHRLDRVEAHDWCRREDHRHIMAHVGGGFELHNVYVPAGGDIPDPDRNPKFAHKLCFLDAMAAWCAARRSHSAGDRWDRALLVGDLNVAPLQTDVWSHKRLHTSVTHTEIEIAALARVQKAFGAVDVMRRFVPKDQPLFTWWSYRARDWRAANKGRRLDHVWATPAADTQCRNLIVAQEVRGWERPSDHVPVIVDLELR